jgi:uncharacterized alpha-E superfamily protein
MLSRVADSIYWMSRYVERAENLARFVDVTFNMMLDLPPGSAGQWQPLVSTTGEHEWFDEHYGVATQENVVRFLTFDPDYPNSILCCLQAARENARSVRETISSEMWEDLNSFYLLVVDAATSSGSLPSLQDFFHEVRNASYRFKGITDGTMPHGEPWHFARLGRYIERADKTSRILDVKYFLLLPDPSDVGTSYDDLQWSAVLRSVSGLEMFRKRHHGITPERVVGFLILDRMFPRSIMYCVNEADQSLHAISGSPLGTFWNAAEKRMGKLRSELAYAHVDDDIIEVGLHEFLDALQTKLNSVGQAISETFIVADATKTNGARTQVQSQSMP